MHFNEFITFAIVRSHFIFIFLDMFNVKKPMFNYIIKINLSKNN